MSTLNLGDSLILNTDYSTSEVKTGATWIDGKPIYRKVISDTTNNSSSVKAYAHGVSNMESLVNISILVKETVSWIGIPYYANVSNYAYYYIDVTNLNICVADAGWQSKPFKAILEYTKTTD